jgi:hypothetical protein
MATTESSPASPPRRSLRVLWLSVMAFVAIAGFLALQLRSGHDPAFANAGANAAPAPRVVIHRVVRKRVVVVDVIPARTRGGGGSGGKAGGSATSSTTAPTGGGTSAPAPAAASQAPAVGAPAPVPAPAPAPVTKSS